MNRLNWGCAFDVRKDWVNSDLIDYGQEHVGDLLDGLPFPDNHFDCIVAQHSLQMITFEDLPRALRELRRVLKIGGTLRISVPDIERAINHLLRKDADYFPISKDLEPTLSGRALRYIFWHGDARSGFTFESLRDTLKRNGFQNVRKCGFEQTYSECPDITSLDSREAESLIVEGVK